MRVVFEEMGLKSVAELCTRGRAVYTWVPS